MLVIFPEDMYAVAKTLLAGWNVTYAGNGQYRHSHNHTIFEDFELHFDMGMFLAFDPWIRQRFGGAGSEDKPYGPSEPKFLILRRFYLWPGGVVRNAIKLLGYRLGPQEAKLPIGLKYKLGMYKRYWCGPYAVKKLNKGD